MATVSPWPLNWYETSTWLIGEEEGFLHREQLKRENDAHDTLEV